MHDIGEPAFLFHLQKQTLAEKNYITYKKFRTILTLYKKVSENKTVRNF